MEQRVHLITLGVADLGHAADFYEALGWVRVPGAPPGLVAFDLYGATLGLFPKADLEAETGCAALTGGTVLSHNVRDTACVDQIMAAAEAAGAKVLRTARKAVWGGYHGHFQDPDGHVWEIAHNPFSALGPDGQFQWGGA